MIAEAPNWLLEEINAFLRAWFWAGEEEVHGGQYLVVWNQVCRPLRYGGLGVKDLHLQGLSLWVRWEWLQRTDVSRP